MLNSLRILDLFIMIASFALATVPVMYESRGVSFPDFLTMRVKVQNLLLFLGLLLAWHIIFTVMGLYETPRLAEKRKPLLDGLQAAFVGTLCLGVMSSLAQIRMVDLLFLGTFWASCSVMVILSR